MPILFNKEAFLERFPELQREAEFHAMRLEVDLADFVFEKLVMDGMKYRVIFGSTADNGVFFMLSGHYNPPTFSKGQRLQVVSTMKAQVCREGDADDEIYNDR